MGRDPGALERAAAQVSADLVDISEALDEIARHLPRRAAASRAHLLDVADRVQRMHDLLAAELDRARPDRPFLRKLIAVSALAASAAAGFCADVAAGEVSQRLDLRSPIEVVHDRSGSVTGVHASVEVDGGWEVTVGDQAEWEQAIAVINQADTLTYDVRRLNGSVEVTFTVANDRQVVRAELAMALPHPSEAEDHALAVAALHHSVRTSIESTKEAHQIAREVNYAVAMLQAG